jgi:hypothetical protein
MTPAEQLDKLEPTLRAMAPDILRMGRMAHQGNAPFVTLPYEHFMVLAAFAMAWLADKDAK